MPGAVAAADEEAGAADALVALERAVRRLLPPSPLDAGRPARSLLAATTTKRPPAAPAAAAAAADSYQIADYAYVVFTLTPRRRGAKGVCPPGGARGAEGQKLAATLMRSVRLAPQYSSATLKPLQCWEKPGVWDQVIDRASGSAAAPWHAYWVMEASRWPVSDGLATELLFGDHTFFTLPNNTLTFPRNSSCYTGKISAADGMYAATATGGKISLPLRAWCSAQNRAGRQALGLHLAYVTRAKKGVATCEDGLWNGAESGTDCGTPCKDARCLVGEGCSDAGDCPKGIGCDSAQFQDPGDRFQDGYSSLGGFGTCALTCRGWASSAAGACPSGTVADERYADKYCEADKANGVECTGKTYAPPINATDAKPCCSTTAPCSSITTCNPTTQYANADLNVRCSGVPCTSGDNAKCCIDKAACSTVFSTAVCASVDANSIYNPAGYCSGATCDKTLAADKAACCTPRAQCSTLFTSAAVCQANDPNAGGGTGLVYSVNGSVRCAGTSCNAASDWTACCTAALPCSTGYFTGGRTCPSGTEKAPGNPNCAGRTCSASDSATCCAAVVQKTCQVWSAAATAADPNNPACSLYGSVIANPAATSCWSNSNCNFLCCTSVGTATTCDTIRAGTNGATFCGADSTWFLSPPLYGGQCSLTVSNSCVDACCRKS